METKSGIVLRSIFAILASFIFGIGRVVYADNSIAGMWQKPGEFLLIFACTGILFYLALLVMELLLDTQELKKTLASITEHKFFLPSIMLILAVLYGICYLTYFPGIFGYDIDQQTWQITGSVPWNNHHPVLHTLIWKVFYDLEKDSGERTNEINNPEYREVILKMQREQLRWYQGTCDVVPLDFDARFNKEMLFAMAKAQCDTEEELEVVRESVMAGDKMPFVFEKLRLFREGKKN